MPEFGNKNVLFAYFWARILKKLSYFKSAPANLTNYKLSRKKQKGLNLRPTMPYLGNSVLEFESNVLIFEI